MKITKEELENIVAEVVSDVYAIDEKLPTSLRPADRKVRKMQRQLNPGDPDYPSTMGELRHLIKLIQSSKRSDKLAREIPQAVMDFLPGGVSAFKTINFLRNVYSAPDDKKTNTDLDKLNIDDEISKIVDDTIENKFFKFILDKFKNRKDEDPIPDLNSRLQRYLRRTHLGRTISDLPQGDLFESTLSTGESTMKITQQELIDIIRESINDIDQEDERREELISVIYDKMREMSPAENKEAHEENFDLAKQELLDDKKASSEELENISLDDILNMDGPLTFEQELKKIIKEETEQVLSEFEE